MSELQVEPLTRDFLEIASEVGPASGYDHLSANIIALLFLEPEEVSMEELVEMTGYSKASISQKLKILVPMGFVKRRTRPGSKKIYLYMEKDVFIIWKEQIKHQFLPEIRIVKDKVPQLIEKYKNKELTSEQEEKLHLIEKYYSQILQVETIINSLFLQIDELSEGE